MMRCSAGMHQIYQVEWEEREEGLWVKRSETNRAERVDQVQADLSGD